MLLPPFGSVDLVSRLFRLFGRLHPAVVHFPIALLVVAAMLELVQLIRRKPGLAPATPVCLILGAASAVAASFLGWLLDDGSGGTLVGIHKWAGLLASGVAFVAVVLVWKVESPRAARMLRPTLFVGAGLVGLTGYLGGELVFGRNHLFKELFAEDSSRRPQPAPTFDKNVAAVHAVSFTSVVATADNVDFTRDVAPILSAHCLRCHGGDKVKGKFSLKTRLTALKGGKSGPGIVPGQAKQSTVYTALIDTDLDSQMPPPREKRPSREQIEIVRKWIDQGARWPDGVELR